MTSNDFSFGIDYLITDNFSIGVSYERGDYASFKFVYKNDPIKTFQQNQYARGDRRRGDNKYTQLINNLEENGIGVKKLTRNANSIGLQLTQVIHPNLRVVEDIIARSARDAGITEDIVKDIEIANLIAIQEIDDSFRASAQTIYERSTTKRYSTNTRANFRPFLASREEFFKGAFLVENDTEFIIRKDLFSPMLQRLSFVGKTALTSYLLQSVVATIIFYGFGLGLFGEVDRIGQLIVVFFIWWSLLVGCQWWMQKYKYGPVEWVWRCLTNLNIYQFKK